MKNYKTLNVLKSMIIGGPLIGVGIISIAASCGHNQSVKPVNKNKVIAPYMDYTVNVKKRSVANLVEHHINHVTLAFVQQKSKTNNEPIWYAGTPLGENIALQKWTSDFKAKGGNVAISFGGAAGIPLWGGTSSTVNDAYKNMEKAIKLYQPERIDYDVEGTTATKISMEKLVGAANKIHQAHPKLPISLTLAAEPSGFSSSMITSGAFAEFKNFNFTPIVNIMAMDYDPLDYAKYQDMWLATLATIIKTTNQLSTILNNFSLTPGQWLKQHYGITPMIGQNDGYDLSPQMWSFKDTQELMQFNKQYPLKLIAYWSLTADFPGPYTENNQSSGFPGQTKPFQFYDHFYQGLGI